MRAGEAARWLGAARWQACSDLDPGRLDALLTRCRAALAAGPEPRKRERDKAMFALAFGGGEPELLLKIERHEHASIAKRIRGAGAASQLAVAETLAAQGLPTPLPLAAGICRRRGLLTASLLLVPVVADAVDLAAFWRDPRSPRRQRRAAARELGALARRLHEAGLDQDDFAPNNFLWRASTPPHVLAIDFERARVRRSLARAVRVRQLAKLDRHASSASASDRLRVLRTYAGGDAQRARAWWHAVALEHGALARRDFRHLLRTGTRASRRFVPVAHDGWRGWARREAVLAPILEALGGAPGAGPPGVQARALGALDARASARAWAAALTLAQRGCMPAPVALLHRPAHAVLVLESIGGAQRIADAEREGARGALVGLLGRLLSFGFEPLALPMDAIELAPAERGGWRALALDPRGLRAGRPRRAPPIRAREWAAQLLAAVDSASPTEPRG